MLNDKKYDFSEETNIKEKLYEECMEKQKELNDKKVTRIPVSLAELENRVITKIDKNKGKDNEIKMDKER